MPKMIFVNLPVADVARATAFYETLGFEKDARFSGPHASSMKWSDGVIVGLLDRGFYATLTPKRIIDARQDSGVLLAIARDSRAEVDAIAEAALAAGGREAHGPEDQGFMYSRGFEDLDGHGWGPFYMDVAAFEAAQASVAESA